MTDKTLISIVTPFFNEGEVVAAFYESVTKVANTIPDVEFEFVCVNDGSQDDTLVKLAQLVADDARVRVIDLSRNFGKEAALTAGLDESRGDAVIPMDADLQDPPELIAVLISHWRKGYEVVLAKRSDRRSDSYLKRKTAEFFYRLHNRISDIPLPEDVGDFRLIDRAVVTALHALPERRRFMKGLFAWVGFKTTTVEYVRIARVAGKTKFSGWWLWNFALEGITSFSTMPLRVWTYLGTSFAVIGFLYALFIILRVVILGIDLPGYASLLTVILVLGGIQLIGIGVIGEYIGRIYIESKQRPIYIVRNRLQKK